MSYEVLKSLHIIFVISWFAGLFYLPRLLVYHVESQGKSAIERDILSAQFEKMAKLLFNAIMVPAMVLTWLTGLSLIYSVYWESFVGLTWLHLKLGFVVCITIYHFYCRYVILQFRKKNFVHSGSFLRLFNEIATILLVAVVFLVVGKNSLDWVYALIGFTLFAILIMFAVKLAKKWRG